MTPTILVATDGKPGALGALRTARRLAERDGARVDVLAVYEPMDLYAVGSPDAIASLPPHFVPAAIEAVGKRVRAQLDEVGGGAAGWPITVETGRVAPVIARAAAKRGASLVLLGLRHPGPVERWLARETLLRLVQLVRVPVLAVAEAAADLPRKGVVAIDFSEFSLRVAREALDRLAPGAHLHLVHAIELPAPGDGWTESVEWVRVHRSGVEQRLRELAAELERSGKAAVQVHILEGDPGSAILRLTEELGADLIAAGSHGAGFVGRLVLGSVSSNLVHGARCSLLIAPPEDSTAEPFLELSERELLASLGRAGELALRDPATPE